MNVASEPAGPGLPSRAASPYRGVGTLAQVDLRWADVFGNRAVTPFTAPPASYTGPLNNAPVSIEYVDRLIRQYYEGGRRWAAEGDEPPQATAGAPVAPKTLRLSAHA